MKAVASRVTEKSDVLLLTAVDMDDSGPYEIAEPRVITALETYTPSCQLAFCSFLWRLLTTRVQGSKPPDSNVLPKSSLHRQLHSRKSSNIQPIRTTRPTTLMILPMASSMVTTELPKPVASHQPCFFQSCCNISELPSVGILQLHIDLLYSIVVFRHMPQRNLEMCIASGVVGRI